MKRLSGRILSLFATAAFSAVMLGGCGESGDRGDSNSGNANDNLTTEKRDPTVTATGWTCGQVAMGGGGFVTGVFSTCEQDVYYARTDVGGAYRWDKSKGKCVTLSNIAGVSWGVDGLAVDPNNAARVFLLTGMGSDATILVSDDYGDTFTKVPTDLIIVHGNGGGRQNGEKIAVDPNDPDVLFAGGRTGGVIKSTAGRMAWSKVEGFKEEFYLGSNAGIASIVFDETTGTDGKATRRIFIAVSRSGKANIFVSENGGKDWSAVSELPNEYNPQRMRFDSNGRLVIAFAAGEGPGTTGEGGGIIRYDPNTKQVEDISPKESIRIGDVVMDPTNPDRMVACTQGVWTYQSGTNNYGDEIYTTEDGGKTWRNITENFTVDNMGTWISGSSIHWAGCLSIDPFNTGKIMIVSGNGIFACDDIFAETPAFYFNVKGLEETVTLDATMGKGSPFLSAVGDYDGFINTSPTEYGTRYNPGIGNNSGIAVAGSDPSVMFRSGKDAYYSEDGGQTWTVTAKPTDASSQGNVTVSADGSRIFWSPSNGGVYYSTDKGATWTKCAGIAAQSYIRGDSINPNYIYAMTASAFYVSSDGGANFKQTLSNFTGTKRFAVSPDKEGVIYNLAAGLQISEDYGQTFTRINNLTSVSSVSAGAGKDENSPNAVYIYGEPEGQPEGLYWSTDGCETWERIDDDLHYYGTAEILVGDANKFGRCYLGTGGLGVAYFEKNFD